MFAVIIIKVKGVKSQFFNCSESIKLFAEEFYKILKMSLLLSIRLLIIKHANLFLILNWGVILI
jgi:hypothetical protein